MERWGGTDLTQREAWRSYTHIHTRRDAQLTSTVRSRTVHTHKQIHTISGPSGSGRRPCQRLRQGHTPAPALHAPVTGELWACVYVCLVDLWSVFARPWRCRSVLGSQCVGFPPGLWWGSVPLGLWCLITWVEREPHINTKQHKQATPTTEFEGNTVDQI